MNTVVVVKAEVIEILLTYFYIIFHLVVGLTQFHNVLIFSIVCSCHFQTKLQKDVTALSNLTPCTLSWFLPYSIAVVRLFHITRPANYSHMCMM